MTRVLLNDMSSGLALPEAEIPGPYTAPQAKRPPQRHEAVDLTQYSFVLQNPLRCYISAPCRFRGGKGYEVLGGALHLPPGGGDCPADSPWQHTSLLAQEAQPSGDSPADGADGGTPGGLSVFGDSPGSRSTTAAIGSSSSISGTGSATDAGAAPVAGGGEVASGDVHAQEEQDRVAAAGKFGAAMKATTLICMVGVAVVGVLWVKRASRKPVYGLLPSSARGRTPELQML